MVPAPDLYKGADGLGVAGINKGIVSNIFDRKFMGL